MITMSGASSGLWQWRSHGRGSSKRTHSMLRKVRGAVEASVITIGVAISSLAMFVPVNVLQLPSVWKHSSAASASTTQPSKPNLIKNASGDSLKCDAPAASASADFASCPSFVLDYSKIAKSTVNDKYWNVALGHPNANQEAQVYTANTQNVRIENGSLVLQARANPQPGTGYTSAKIDTKGKEDFLYGKLVVKAKMPAGIGTWPAIWMLPSQPKYAHVGPSTDSNFLKDGEIDIAEAVGTQPHTVYSVAHSLSYDDNGVDKTYFNTAVLPDNDGAYHDYEMDWTPTTLTFKVDGATFFVYSKAPGADYRSWPYDQPFYLIINLALGGTWGGQDRKDFPADGIDPSALPASLNVRSVQYYSYIGQK